MELSPPSLTRSPSTPPISYCPISSPDLIQQQYKLQSVFDTGCNLINTDNTLRSSVDLAQAGWSSPSSMIAPITSSAPSVISNNMIDTDYHAGFGTYSEPSVTHYNHDMYAQSNANTHSTDEGSPAPTSSRSPYGTPFQDSMSLPMRKKEDAREAYAAATASLESAHFSSPRPMHSAASFITDVYGPPHGTQSYLMDNSQHSSHHHHQPHQQNQHLSHVHHSQHASPQSYYPPPPSMTSHGLTHDILMSSTTPHAANGLTESILADRRLHLRVRRAPRRLTTKEEANYQCTIKGCGKLFSRSYNYKAHLETHDEKREYPFPCQVPDCTKKFVRRTDLQRHTQSVHEKQRNHPCDYCGRKFARKDTLRRHMEDGCSKRFDIGSIDLQDETTYDPVALQHQRMISASHSLSTLPPSQQSLPSLDMGSVTGLMHHSAIPHVNNIHGWAP